MTYYLHRISHHCEWSYPLLEEKGLLSIGWAHFGARPDFLSEHQGDWSKVPRTIENECGKIRSRYCLQRFLEMEPGDQVVIPTWGAFHVYEVCDHERLTPAQIDVAGLKSWNDRTAEARDGYLVELEDGGTNRTIDLGFFRRVKVRERDIPRRGYADAALTSRMKIRLTNVHITDLTDKIEEAVRAYANETPINPHHLIIDHCQENVRTVIQEKMNPDQFEELISLYFRTLGARTRIPPKNERDKVGDADVVATFGPLNVTVCVQAKHHEGLTDEWAVEQIEAWTNNKKREELDSDFGEAWLSWVVSSGSFSKDCEAMANRAHVRLIDGREFARMLLDAGIRHLEELR